MRILDLSQGLLSPQEAFVDAILYGQTRIKGKLPKILSFYPAAYNNPFQDLLYKEAESQGFVTLPCHKLEDLGKINWGDLSYLHIHWLKNILSHCETKFQAEKALDKFERFLVTRKKSGHKILWTVHNVLPHEMTFSDHEIKLRQVLCHYADKIHSLSKKTEAACTPYFSIPKEKIFHTKHPSYQGYYPDTIDQGRARYELGFSDEIIYLFFGSLAPYKNISFLLKAFNRLNTKSKTKRLLLIAGKSSSRAYLTDLKKQIKDSSNSVHLHEKKIPFERVSWYFKACNAVLLPYGETLNSGVAALAKSFNKDLIAPQGSSAEDVYNNDQLHSYQNNHEESFIQKILSFEKKLPSSPNASLKKESFEETSKLFFENLLRTQK